MLNQHLLDCRHREIGIDGLAAELIEGVEALDKSRISAALLLDFGGNRARDLRNVVFEFGGGLVPLLVVRLAIAEEFFQQLDQVGAVAYVFV